MNRVLYFSFMYGFRFLHVNRYLLYICEFIIYYYFSNPITLRKLAKNLIWVYDFIICNGLCTFPAVYDYYCLKYTAVNLSVLIYVRIRIPTIPIPTVSLYNA